MMPTFLYRHECGKQVSYEVAFKSIVSGPDLCFCGEIITEKEVITALIKSEPIEAIQPH